MSNNLITDTNRVATKALLSEIVQFSNDYCHCTATTLRGNRLRIAESDSGEVIANMVCDFHYEGQCIVMTGTANGNSSSVEQAISTEMTDAEKRKAVAIFANEVRELAGIQCNDWDATLASFNFNV